MGICWDGGAFDYYIQKYWEMQPMTVLFVPGNHENYPEIMRHPFIDTPWGDKAYQITENVYCLRRGGYYTIEGKTFFTFGGAQSHDMHCRKEGVSWWKEELPTGEECEYGFEVLAAHGNKADFLITHCADDIILRKIEAIFRFHSKHDILTNYLRIIKSVAEFGHHYFGHYHYNDDFDEKTTVLYNKIIQII